MTVAIASSLWSSEPVWDGVRLIDRRNIGLIRYLRRIWRDSRGADVVILNGALGFGAWYCDLLAAMLLKRKRVRPWIVLADCTWQPRSRSVARRAPWLGALIPRIARLMIAAIDHDRVIYCVLSTAERDGFARTWRVDPRRVAFTPFCHTLYDEQGAGTIGDYVFAGGNSMRDYPLLVEAFATLDLPLRIAASYRAPALPHVRSRPLPHEAYMAELRGARHVAVPLEQAERSAGQQTYLNAMALGKLVVVNDVIGVRDYIVHGETGLVVDSTPQGFADAFRWAEAEENRAELERIRAAGQHAARTRHSLSAYLSHLLAVATAVAERGVEQLGGQQALSGRFGR